jgi:hypothetical protein
LCPAGRVHLEAAILDTPGKGRRQPNGKGVAGDCESEGVTEEPAREGVQPIAPHAFVYSGIRIEGFVDRAVGGRRFAPRSDRTHHGRKPMSRARNRPGAAAVARAGIILAASLAAMPALAALGGDATTVTADQVHVSGKLSVVHAQRYAVHEIVVPSGATLRQFVSPAGKVFGVAWAGPTMPDLRQALGPYFEPYATALSQRRFKGPVLVELPGLVVQSTGHQRAFAGRAYVPEAVPPGVDVDEIR